MPELHLLSRILHLLDLEFHLVQVSFQLLLVLLVAHFDLLETFAQLISVTFNLHVLSMSLIQLLAHSVCESFNYVLNVGEA